MSGSSAERSVGRRTGRGGATGKNARGTFRPRGPSGDRLGSRVDLLEQEGAPGARQGGGAAASRPHLNSLKVTPLALSFPSHTYTTKPLARMHGLTCLVDSLTHAIPLVRVTVQATLSDVSAKVHVQQEYKNDGPARSDCQYRFPVPARAAVWAFALRKEDGSKVVGVVKEKEEARISYDDAVKDGKLASLMEQDSPDSASTLRSRLERASHSRSRASLALSDSQRSEPQSATSSQARESSSSLPT